MGKRLLRELQLQATRRAARRGDLLLSGRGAGRRRELATPVQHRPPALLAGLPTTRARGRALAGHAVRTRAHRGAQADHALRLPPDHPMGAGHTHATTSSQIGIALYKMLLMRASLCHVDRDPFLNSYGATQPQSIRSS